jgi:glyoxylase-like metal-dependent hydrolase (beta-lactamase superfamily II)
MQVDFSLFGEYQTNCFIITQNNKSIIIDPGMGADEWVIEEAKNPIAIINTHGHFDHIWSNASIKNHFNIPIIIHQKDEFMLQNDIFSLGTPSSKADILIDSDKTINVDEFEISFKHFPGHTPGSMTVEIGEFMFSGDFVFKGTIGRYDFPYSNRNDMKNSIEKFLTLDYDKTIYPGHGTTTSIKEAKKDLEKWLKVI